MTLPLPPQTGRMVIRDGNDTRKFLAQFDQIQKPFTLAWTQGDKRSISQNALLHKWYGEIAEQRGDTDATTVKGECHRQWGLTIRLRDEGFAWVWKRTGAGLDYERQCKMLASGVLGVSSGMTKAELKEYMDAMRQHYAEAGVVLTDPEDRK